MRYFTPGTNTPKSLFVPLPLEFMGEKMQAAQTGYDTAMDDAATASQKLSVNYLPEHKEFAQTLLDTYQSKFNKVVDEMESTGDYKGASRKITSLVNGWANDPMKNELETSYSNYNDYVKGVRDLGVDYIPYGDPHRKFVGKYDNGEIEPFRYTRLGKYLDIEKKASDMMSDIVSEGYLNEITVPDDVNGRYVKTKYGSEGVSATKVAYLASLKADEFLSSKEGQQMIDRTMYYNPTNPTTGKEWTEEDLWGEAIDALTSAGANRIGLKTTYGKDYVDYDKWRVDKLNTPEVPINPATSFNVKGMDLTDDFTRKTRSTGSKAVTGAMTGYVPGGLGVSYNTAEENSYPWVNWSDKQKAIYKKIGAAYGLEDLIDKVFSGKAPELEDSAAKFMSTYTKLLNQAFQEAPTATAFSSEDAEEATTIAFGKNPTVKNLNSAFASANHFYDPNTGEVYNSWADLKARLLPTISDYANDNSDVRVSSQVKSAEHSMPIATADSEGNPDWSFTNPYVVTIGSYPIYMSNYAGTTKNKTKGKVLATTSKIYNASKLSLNNTPISVGKLFNDSDLYTVKTFKNSKTETITYPGTKVSIPSGSYAVSNTLTTEDGKEHTVVGVGVDPASALDDYKNEQTLFLQTLKK